MVLGLSCAAIAWACSSVPPFSNAILRRDSQTTAYGGTTTYVHDNKTVAQSSTTNAPSNPVNNYLTVPGTGEVLAFSSTVGGTTSTYVPIADGQGSTIGLVNSSNVLQTQFSYDPWGNPTANGSASQYPFLFKGMEYDATDFYYGGGVYYSPALGRPLQQVSPGGGAGGGGGIDASVASAQGSGGLRGIEDSLANNAANAAISGAAGAAAAGLASFITINEVAVSLGPVFWTVAGVADAILGILDLFGFDLFGGGGSAPIIPNGYYRLAHYVLSRFIGVFFDLTPNMEDSASSGATVVEVRLIFPNIPEDPTQSFDPGEGWESRPNGNWSNPGPPQQGLHPDPHEGYSKDRKGPHFDWQFRKEQRTFSIRNKGGNIQFWDQDLQQWLETIPEDLPELMIP